MFCLQTVELLFGGVWISVMFCLRAVELLFRGVWSSLVLCLWVPYICIKLAGMKLFDVLLFLPVWLRVLVYMLGCLVLVGCLLPEWPYQQSQDPPITSRHPRRQMTPNRQPQAQIVSTLHSPASAVHQSLTIPNGADQLFASESVPYHD